MRTEKTSLVGISGWLAVFALRLLVGIVGDLTAITKLVPQYEGFTLTMGYYFLASALLLLTMFLLYKRSPYFRISYIVFSIVEVAVYFPSWSSMLAIALAEGIWIVYLFRSRRVRNTCFPPVPALESATETNNELLENTSF